MSREDIVFCITAAVSIEQAPLEDPIRSGLRCCCLTQSVVTASIEAVRARCPVFRDSDNEYQRHLSDIDTCCCRFTQRLGTADTEILVRCAENPATTGFLFKALGMSEYCYACRSPTVRNYSFIVPVFLDHSVSLLHNLFQT